MNPGTSNIQHSTFNIQREKRIKPLNPAFSPPGGEGERSLGLRLVQGFNVRTVRGRRESLRYGFPFHAGFNPSAWPVWWQPALGQQPV